MKKVYLEKKLKGLKRDFYLLIGVASIGLVISIIMAIFLIVDKDTKTIAPLIFGVMVIIVSAPPMYFVKQAITMQKHLIDTLDSNGSHYIR